MWMDEYEQYMANVDKTTKELILKMSASSMGRMLKGLPRIKPGHTKANMHSGRNNELKNAIPCHSGEVVRACDIPPGDVQIDTFALGGGNPAENFFWILDATDRKNQWTVINPTWNRGQYATLEALKRIKRKIPFPIQSLHGDNGAELSTTILRHSLERIDQTFICPGLDLGIATTTPMSRKRTAPWEGNCSENAG